MKKIAIMQPTFLPWPGYFDLIDQADEFVFLDTVQFQVQSWQQRNRLIGPSGLEWITVPVRKSGRFGQTIAEAEIAFSMFPRKQIRTIQHRYAKAPFFRQYWDEMQEILLFSLKYSSISELNIKLIQWMLKSFKIHSKLHLASDLNITGGRPQRLVSIVRSLDAECYLSPPSSVEYLREDKDVFDNAGIEIIFQNYVPKEYKQRNDSFIAGASAIDLLFNMGPKSLEIIRGGRQRSRMYEEVISEK